MSLRSKQAASSYQSRQTVWSWWIILPMMSFLVIWFDNRDKDGATLLNAAWILLAVNVSVLLMFAQLKIRLASGQLQWQYGVLGWPSWSLAVEDIIRVELCEIPPSAVKGLRFTREGMLYDASGSGAIRIIKKDGSSLRLGTDEPEVLCACLQIAMSNLADQPSE